MKGSSSNLIRKKHIRSLIKAQLLRCPLRSLLDVLSKYDCVAPQRSASYLELFSTTLTLFLVLFYIQTAGARIYVQIDQASEKKFPVAITNLVPNNHRNSSDWNTRISEKIKKDLELTGLFEIISSEQYPQSPGALSTDPAMIQFPPWSLIGAQALVNGSYSNAKGGVQVVLSLYDPVIGQRLLNRTYVTRDSEMSVVAHHFSDEIMKELSGERGVFSTKIAYVQAQKKGKKEIGVMDMDGDNATLITKDRSINLSPAWSPDGSKIAYTTFGGRGGTPEAAVIGSSGGMVKRITANGTVNISPTWTPSGQLTLSSAMHGDTDIYLMSLAGDVIKKITGSFGIDVNPSWSPDGSQLVFASERAGRLHLFKADAHGGSVERLTFVGVQNDNPAWSPKGDKIVFQSLEGNWDLFVMNTDGSMLQRLTSGQGNNESPSWAPNGRFIVFSSTQTGSTKVTLMREDGSNVTPIGESGTLQPAWGPWVK